MIASLKSLFGLQPARIDPPRFGPFANGLLALNAANAAAVALGQGAHFLRTAGTPSMVPLIPAAITFIVVKPRPCDDAILGKVVTYTEPADPNGSRTHRIVGKLVFGRGYIARGDNNPSNDPNPVTSQNLKGEIAGIYLVSPPQDILPPPAPLPLDGINPAAGPVG